tara:strand:+ start:34 stop:216 length:183 start_codon:yes stop_codon:yes gene_type:complete
MYIITQINPYYFEDDVMMDEDGMEVLKFKTKAEAKKFLSDEFHLTESEIFVNGLEVVYLQ